MSGIEDYLGIPKAGTVNQRVAIKDIIEQLSLSGSEKKLFESDIYSVHLIGVLDADTIHVLPYRDEEYLYETIYVIKAILKSNDHFSFVVETIHAAFPNPLIIIFEKDEKWVISLAPKRINKNNSNKSVFESVYSTDWFTVDDQHRRMLENLNLSEKTSANMKGLYEVFLANAYSERLIRFIGCYPSKIPQGFATIQRIKLLECEFTILHNSESSYNTSMMMAEKMEIYTLIKKTKASIALMIDKFREDSIV